MYELEEDSDDRINLLFYMVSKEIENAYEICFHIYQHTLYNYTIIVIFH